MTDNPFALFQLPPRYELDTEVLRERLQALQKAAHPDRHAHEAGSDRLRAANESARINEAYLCLKDPVRRAEALAQLKGVKLPSGETTVRQPELLMEQMLLRERLENCGVRGSVSELEKLWAEVEAMIAQTKNQLSESLDAERPDSEDVTRGLMRLKFLTKLEHELSLAEEKIAAQ